MPMTPLQSWALIVLLAVFVLGLIWLSAEAEAALRRRHTDKAAAQQPQDEEADSSLVPSPVPTARPTLRLIQGQGQGSARSRRGPAEVYDWARRGI
ncbi:MULTISPECIES: hypothetical protein [unclassified Arthrobacter]|uniref:hypothetical protein n=1 Tax=unclassified Arthrobacter TaxID=235627 RepID=UPI00115CD5D3|nr:MULTISPECIES: hypothetical protein [unclassified Arthrobacter]TQS92007.1 hypothetical protein EU811_13195 [Arthrobacter sp. TS-15]BCW06911.1 hypothetical protein NtRootA1_30490 [Arthrobacter sp. NtRootA1]